MSVLQFLHPFIVSSLYWVIAIWLIFYVYMKYAVYNFWKKCGVPYDEPSVPFGNVFPYIIKRKSLGNIIKESYQKFKNHSKFHGMFMLNQPVLMINDPELVRAVLIKEFNKFIDRGGLCNEEVDPSTMQLFFLPGERWRHLRAKLSPTFTSGKLKGMFSLLKDVGDELNKATGKMVDQNSIIDVKDLVSRYTTDTISSTAFGFNCNSLENPEHEFKRHAKMIFDQNPFMIAAGFFAPKLLEFLKIPFNRADATGYFFKTFEDMLRYRRENSIERHDFMKLLDQLLQTGKLDDEKDTADASLDKISMTEAMAQAFVFFIAGYETTSSTVTYALYELAKHPEHQTKLVEEIDREYYSETGITYDKLLNGMPYLDMVFCEILRMHPSLPFLNRLCVEDYQIPDSDFCIRKGTPLMISVTGIHDDPEFYPEPKKFIPERFSKENVAKRPSCHYLPFGDGPRMCIGNRFGIVQSKMAMVALLANYEFTVCEKTPIPVQYTKKTSVQAPDGPMYLRVTRRIH